MLQYEPAVYPHYPHENPRSIPKACSFRRKAGPGGGFSEPPGGPGLGDFSEVIDFDDVGRETLARQKEKSQRFKYEKNQTELWDLESEVFWKLKRQGFLQVAKG